jgi:hypothetical protein
MPSVLGGTEIEPASRSEHAPLPCAASSSHKKGNLAMTISFRSILAILLFSTLLASCKKDDASTNSDQYTDNLKLGTGMNASNFTLSGETTSFVGTPNNMIYWRLESKDDMAGSSVTMRIEKNVNGAFSTVQSFPFPNPQTYGHIMISAFLWNQTGSYRATGILNANSKVVATRDFTVQ